MSEPAKIYPTVSVVIPVKNEALKIRDCIEGILSQTVPVQEIIVIDSGSEDGTIEILKQYNKVVLIEIPGNEFNHGNTRNLGAGRANGEFVLLTVGDAKPYNEKWIEELLRGFDNEKVAGVCGQQVVPHDRDKNPVDWFRPQSDPSPVKYHFDSPEDFYKLSPGKKKTACGWDDVNALYRKEILQKIPFRKTSYAEDILWAKDTLIAGYALVYNYNSRVYHYHNENAAFSYKRTFTVLYYRYKAFDYIPAKKIFTMKDYLRVMKLLFTEPGLSFRERIHWTGYNFDRINAIKKATRDFIDYLQKGEKELDAMHEKICGQPPVPIKE